MEIGIVDKENNLLAHIDLNNLNDIIHCSKVKIFQDNKEILIYLKDYDSKLNYPVKY